MSAAESILTPKQRQNVRAKLAAELNTARADLSSARGRLRTATTAHERAVKTERAAWAKYAPRDGKPDATAHPTYAAWRAAHEELGRTGPAYLGTHDLVVRLRKQVARLSDPAELQERLRVRAANEQRFRDLRGRASTDADEASVDGRPGSSRSPNEGGNMAANATSKENGNGNGEKKQTSSVPDEIVDRIVKTINSGKGLSTVAKQLNDEKVATPGKSKAWTPQQVRAIYLRKTGLKGVKEQRAKKPLQRSTAAKAPAESASA